MDKAGGKEITGEFCALTSIDKALSDLIKISNVTGKDTALVQGGGGNTSVKTADNKYMYIKASGTGLKNMNSSAGWCKLRLAAVLAIMKDKSIARLSVCAREDKVAERLLLACDEKASANARPSIETHLHAMLGKCVIHLHPVAVLSFTCAKNGKAELQKVFKQTSNPALWVDYANPGFALAKKIAKLAADYQNQFGRKPAVLFLQKHGLIISADSPNDALLLLRSVINRCTGKLKWPRKSKSAGKTKQPNQRIIAETKLLIHKAIFNATGKSPFINYFYDDIIAAFQRQKNAQKLLTPSALTPDELLYANGPAMWIEDCNLNKITGRLSRQIKKGNNPPAAFLVKGVGLFIAAAEKDAATVRDIVRSSLIIRSNALRLGGIVALTKVEQDFIKHWETDAFRKRLAGSTSAVV